MSATTLLAPQLSRIADRAQRAIGLEGLHHRIERVRDCDRVEDEVELERVRRYLRGIGREHDLVRTERECGNDHDGRRAPPHDGGLDRDGRRDREELSYFPPSNGNA